MKGKCPKCGKKFVVGKTGYADPLGCDKCLGIERDSLGTAWFPGQTEMELEDAETGETFVVTRMQRFLHMPHKLTFREFLGALFW